MSIINIRTRKFSYHVRVVSFSLFLIPSMMYVILLISEFHTKFFFITKQLFQQNGSILCALRSDHQILQHGCGSKVSFFSNHWRISQYVPSDITQIGKIILLQRHFFYSFLINNPITFALTKRNKKLKRKVHCALWKIYIVSLIILLIQKGSVHYALYFFEDPDEVIIVWELNEFKTNRRLNYYRCFKKQ